MPKKHNATGRNSHEGRYVRLYHWMLNSAAWKSLSPNARAIYVELASRYAGPGSNNGKIHYSVREAAEALRIGKTTAQRAFVALEDHGFIVAIQRGAFSLKARHATEWLLTEFASDLSGAGPTADKTFMRWSEMQNTVPVAGQSVPVAGQSVPVADP